MFHLGCLIVLSCASATSAGTDAPPPNGRPRAEKTTRLYFAEYKFNDPRLYVMDGDGTKLQELKILPATDWLVLGLQIDPANKKIYWTDGEHREGRIRRANLDGSNVETLLSRLTNPRGLAIDVKGGKMYWSDTQDEVMYRANLDGSQNEKIIDLGRQLGRPTLDLVNQKLYFGKFGAFGDGDIRRSNLDGSNQEILVTSLLTPYVIALDVQDNRFYWADSNTSPRSNYIARARLDGSDVTILYNGEHGSSGFSDITVDLACRKLYWSDEIGDTERGIWKANLDGSNPQRIRKSPDGWNAGVLILTHGEKP
jgi:hypothetical protein